MITWGEHKPQEMVLLVIKFLRVVVVAEQPHINLATSFKPQVFIVAWSLGFRDVALQFPVNSHAPDQTPFERKNVLIRRVSTWLRKLHVWKWKFVEQDFEGVVHLGAW